MPEATVFASADRFRGNGWQYRIPFSPVVDPKHGRIMVGLEPVIEGGIIRQLYVWFDCHSIADLRDPVVIPTPQAGDDTGILTFVYQLSRAASFFAGVWQVVPCKEHSGLMFLSYPPDNATALIVDTLTSSISVHYEIDNSSAPPPEACLQ